MFRYTACWLAVWLVGVAMKWPTISGAMGWRHQLIMLTGLLGLAYMAGATVLALRMRWLECKLGGLDKVYTLHRRMGIAALVSLSLHWLFVEGGRWLVQAGILARSHRGIRAGQIAGEINWRAVAESIGEWAFYGFVIFAVISLYQPISYNRFRFVHKLAGLLFIAGAVHSVLLLDSGAAMSLFNGMVLLLVGVGCLGALISLTGRIGVNRKVAGKVESVRRYDEQVVYFSVRLQKRLDYQPGQFVYLDFKDGEPPHPFTVVSYSPEDNLVEFGVKKLGDYTSYLVQNLESGMELEVEGPYGCFAIPDKAHQVWVGAGIGITPFVSWLQAIAQGRSMLEKVTLYYCVPSKAQAYFLGILERLSAPLDLVDLKVMAFDQGEVLTAEQIAEHMTSKDYAVSFCGPQAFARELKQGLQQQGLPSDCFFNESFSMR